MKSFSLDILIELFDDSLHTEIAQSILKQHPTMTVKEFMQIITHEMEANEENY